MTMRYFSEAEFEGRVRRVREAMAEREIDACIITNPENVYYLTGLNHQGYFAYTSLILPLEREPVLITRKMERAIVQDMVPNVVHYTYSDGIEPLPEASNRSADLTMVAPEGDEALPPSEQSAGLNPWSMSLGVSIRTTDEEALDYDAPMEVTCEAISDLKLNSARIAFEQSSSFLPYRVAQGFVSRMSDVTWLDARDLVNDCRIVQSSRELECTRQAASISDAMVMTGTAMAGPGVPKSDVMAGIYQVMFQRGGTYPAFVPLVRSTRTIAHEHGTWDQYRLQKRDLLFLEMAGCHWRYHAPVGRLIHIGRARSKAKDIHAVALEALYAAADALKPGVTADSVYRVWEKRVRRAKLPHYKRHHCGYIVGIGFPPSWSGSGVPRGLRRGSPMEIRPGMVFHLMSWLLRTGRGDSFLSDTVVVTENGAEFLTRAPRELLVR
jgi:Xaa-Pro dipeptidase